MTAVAGLNEAQAETPIFDHFENNAANVDFQVIDKAEYCF